MNVITWIKVMWKCRYFAKDQRALIYFATKQLDTKKDLCTIEMTSENCIINVEINISMLCTITIKFK